VINTPSDLSARGDMLWGAHLAGASIENSMLGATHALANPLTARFDVTHGIAIGMLLPHVVRHNAEAVGLRYCELAADAGLPCDQPQTAAAALARRLSELVRLAGQPAQLSHFGVTAADLPVMAEEAAEQWTGRFNPRPMTVSNFRELYQCALHCPAETC
jgi:alcohol dehydrogenase